MYMIILITYLNLQKRPSPKISLDAEFLFLEMISFDVDEGKKVELSLSSGSHIVSY